MIIVLTTLLYNIKHKHKHKHMRIHLHTSGYKVHHLAAVADGVLLAAFCCFNFRSAAAFLRLSSADPDSIPLGCAAGG